MFKSNFARKVEKAVSFGDVDVTVKSVQLFLT